MSDSQSWYRNKLSQLRGQPQAPAAPPANSPGWNPAMTRQQAVPYQPVPPTYQQPQQQWPQQTEPPPTTIENLYEQAGHWTGGQAHKVDREPCPSCGGNQYYSRAAGSKRGPPPAPHCYNCGYNGGMFEQGLATSWTG